MNQRYVFPIVLSLAYFGTVFVLCFGFYLDRQELYQKNSELIERNYQLSKKFNELKRNSNPFS
jgi:predicted PurR-regulated permease PerM